MTDNDHQEIGKFFKEILSDAKTGKYSHARVIALFGFFAATVFMWKLIILGGMTIDYFIAYITYTTSTQTFNKYLDNKHRQKTEKIETE